MCLVLRNNFDVPKKVDFHQYTMYLHETKCINAIYYMASSVSGQDEPNRAL